MFFLNMLGLLREEQLNQSLGSLSRKRSKTPGGSQVKSAATHFHCHTRAGGYPDLSMFSDSYDLSLDARLRGHDDLMDVEVRQNLSLPGVSPRLRDSSPD